MIGDWPTPAGLFWLYVGAAPVLLCVTMLLVNPRRVVFSTLFGFIASMWVGYHLTPVLAIQSGGWSSFLLRAEHVETGIAFASLAMLAFLVGYFPLMRREPALALHSLAGRDVPVPSAAMIVSLTLLTLATFLLSIGGPGELWEASYGRGHGQFEAMTLMQQIEGFAMIATSIFSFVIALMAALLLTRRISSPLGWTALAVALLQGMHSFSRTAGFPFLVLAILMIVRRGARGILPSLILVALALWLGWTGFTMRSVNPGIGSFLGAFGSSLSGADQSNSASGGDGLDPAMNPLNALDPWTARAMTRDLDRPGLAEGILGTVTILQPLPSFLVPWQLRMGDSLSVVLGTFGSTGLTTPAMGELYYALGFPGLLLIIPFGLLCAVVDRRFLREQRPQDAVVIVLFLIGFGIGLHSGLRAMTRPILYAWVLHCVASFFVRMRAAARRSHEHGPNRINGMPRVIAPTGLDGRRPRFAFHIRSSK